MFTTQVSSGRLAINNLDDFHFGRAPHPVRCGRGVEIGGGTVVPEINFTLPTMDINAETWPEVRAQYATMARDVCARAVTLGVPSLLLEFETLPPMTVRPEVGAEITRLLADILDSFYEQHGLRSALRLTPNDTREHAASPHARGPLLAWNGPAFRNGRRVGGGLACYRIRQAVKR